jgi:hypothetical protein
VIGDELCTNCGAPRSKHSLASHRPVLLCPPRADGKVPIVAGHAIVDMDMVEHRAITKPVIEWVDPPRPPYIPTFASHLVKR